MRAIGQDDETFNMLKLGGNLLDEGDEGQVQHQHTRTCMVQNPDDLIRKKPRIDRVVNGANAGDAIPGFHMPPGIPGKGRNPITQLDTITLQALGDTDRAPPHITIIRAMEGAFDRPTDDLPPRMLDGGVVQHLMHQ